MSSSESVTEATRSLCDALADGATTMGFEHPPALWWVTLRSDTAHSSKVSFTFTLSCPRGFDADVLSGLRGLLAPDPAIGVALAGTADMAAGAGRTEPGRLCTVLLRDGTTAAALSTPGAPRRTVAPPGGALGGFLARVVGRPSGLEVDAPSVADVAARWWLTCALDPVPVPAWLSGGDAADAVQVAAGNPVGALAGFASRHPLLAVCADVAAAGGGWAAVHVELLAQRASLVATDTPSFELLLSLPWADAGVVAHDLSAMTLSWPSLRSRFAAAAPAGVEFDDLAVAAMAPFHR